MSDGITDANRMTLHDIEIWRQRTKEEFVSKLTTKELVDELCKRGCVTTIIVEDDERTGFCYIVNGNDKATKVWGAATILVIK